MQGAPIDIVIFAPLAPILGVLLFWFLQLLFIESQKFIIEKIRPKHEPLCRFTNFLGIFFQSICHALGYTVTKSGISEFYLSINYGKVAPKKEKKGVFEWISNTFLFLGPFFIPAFIILIFLFFLMNGGFEVSTPTHLEELKYTFGGQLNTFGTSLFVFSQHFINFLINIDLFHPGHFGFILLMIFLGLGIRPSHIGEKKINKIDMLYDLRNVWNLIRHKPLYIFLFFILCYLIFYISFWLNQIFYVAIFSILGWLSIIAIMSLIITHILLFLIKTTDQINGKKRFIPFIMLPVSYTLMRILFFYFPTDFTYSASLLVMILLTFFTAYLLLDSQTNKFKTNIDIKLFKRKNKGEKNEGRRSS